MRPKTTKRKSSAKTNTLSGLIRDIYYLLVTGSYSMATAGFEPGISQFVVRRSTIFAISPFALAKRFSSTRFRKKFSVQSNAVDI